MKVSKQDYFKQCIKLNYEVFITLHQKYLQHFYDVDIKLLKDYALLAIDGSKAEVPNSL